MSSNPLDLLGYELYPFGDEIYNVNGIDFNTTKDLKIENKHFSVKGESGKILSSRLYVLNDDFNGITAKTYLQGESYTHELRSVKLTVDNTTDINGALDVAGTAQLNALNVTGNVDIDGTLDVSGTANLQNAVTMNSTLAVVGDADLNGALDVAGTAQLNALNVTGNTSIADGTMSVRNNNPSTLSGRNDILTLATSTADPVSTGFGQRIQFNQSRGTGSTPTSAGIIDSYISGGANGTGDRYSMTFGVRNDNNVNNVMTLRADPNGDFVGIGIDVPTVELDVVGDAKISGDLAVDTNTLFVDSVNNRLGIGTTDPAAKLNVNGSALIGGTDSTLKIGYVGYSDFTGIAHKDYANTTDYMLIQKALDGQVIMNRPTGQTIQFRESNLTQMTIKSGGNVGIGTDNPSEKLHIVGNIQLEDNNASGYAQTFFKGNSRQYNVGVGGSSTANFANKFYIYDNNANAGRFVIKSDGNVGIGTTDPKSLLHLKTTGGQQVYNININEGNLSATRWYPLARIYVASGGGSGQVQIEGILSGHVPTSQGRSLINLIFAGRAGYQQLGYYIGDTGIQDIESYDEGSGETVIYLRVDDFAQINLNLKLTGTGVLTTPELEYDGSYLTSTPTGTLNFKLSTDTGTNIFRQSLDGNVGIGTVNPSQKLEVNGDGIIGGLFVGDIGYGSQYPGIATSNNINNNGYALIQDNVAGDVLINRPTGGKIQFRENNTNEHMTIESGGNVGIGTNNPAAKLDVVGKIHSDMGNGRTIYLSTPGSNTGLIFNADETFNYSRFNIENVSNATTNNRYTTLRFQDDSNGLSIRKGGNVGIGTTDPAAKLDVNGNANISGDLAVDTNTLFVDSVNNRVGINTITPQYGLDVNTLTRFTQNIEFTGTNRGIVGANYTSLLVYAQGNGNGEGLFLFNSTDDGTNKDAEIQLLREDVITFSTGNNERMRINSSGNVGIGTDNPSESLTINGSSTNTTPTLGLRNGNTGSTSNDGAQIAFGYNGTDDYQHFIQTRHSGGSVTSNAIDFYTCDSTQNNTLTSGSNHVMSLNGTYVGIGTTNPLARLHVKAQSNDGGGSLTNYNQACIVMEGSNSTNKWGMSINNTADELIFTYNLAERGYLNNQANVSQIDFTGQHRSRFSENNEEKLNNIDDYVGMIVSSTGNFINPVDINEALPYVELSTTSKDKKVFGVISSGEDTNDNKREYQQGSFVSVMEIEENDHRAIINSVGEGGMWVCDENGSLENGDYITTSNNSGYGMKQDDDLLHNYTVAKITCDEDFSDMTDGRILENGVKCKFVGVTYHCG